MSCLRVRGRNYVRVTRFTTVSNWAKNPYTHSAFIIGHLATFSERKCIKKCLHLPEHNTLYTSQRLFISMSRLKMLRLVPVGDV